MSNLQKNPLQNAWKLDFVHILLNRKFRCSCSGCPGCNFHSSEIDEDGHCGTCGLTLQ
jgi:hypothetical protein